MPTHHLRLVPAAKSRDRLLSRTLAVASRWLGRMARTLEARRRTGRATDDPLFEFYAEAGAPEGALFVDGQRVGTLPGVRRL